MEQIKNLLKEGETRMSKAVEILKKELARMRSGEASPGLLEGIKVEAYDTILPLNQVANITCPEPRLILIRPWDKSVLPNIEKAIMKSDLGIMPQNDGNVIRLPIPPLTDERKKELIRMVHKIGEETRVAIRNIRRDIIEEIDKLEGIGEDDKKRGEKDVQKLTDEYIDKVNDLISKKEKEIEES